MTCLIYSGRLQAVTYFDVHIQSCAPFDSQIQPEPDPGAPSGGSVTQEPFHGERYTS